MLRDDRGPTASVPYPWGLLADALAFLCVFRPNVNQAHRLMAGRSPKNCRRCKARFFTGA
jgi:hypothetical protein